VLNPGIEELEEMKKFDVLPVILNRGVVG